MMGLLLFFTLFISQAQAEAPQKPIRVLLPSSSYALAAEQELSKVVDEYNQGHSPKVDLLRRCTGYSCIKEMTAAEAGGVLPSLVAIEPSEIKAVEKLAYIKPVPKSEFLKLLGRPPCSPNEALLIPFERTTAMLYIDQEMVFRVHEDPLRAPKTWNELEAMVANFESFSTQQKRDPGSLSGPFLGLSFTGPEGLFLAEALFEKPLWKKARFNRELVSGVQKLQRMSEKSKGIRIHDTYERAIQDFIERKTPLFIGTSDLAPYLKSQVQFRFSSNPVPTLMGGRGTLVTGTDLLVLDNRTEVWRFLEYLYSAQISAKWMRNGSNRLIKLEPLGPNYRLRAIDRHAVRARAILGNLFPLLFQDRSERLTNDSIFLKADQQLSEIEPRS